MYRKDSNIRIANAVIAGGSDNLKRIRKIKDPVIKYSITLDMIQTVMTMSNRVLAATLEEEYRDLDDTLDEANDMLEEYEDVHSKDPDAKSKNGDSVKSLIRKQKKLILNIEHSKVVAHQNQELGDGFFVELLGHLDNLADWVRQPTYSPDHPLGVDMMNETSATTNVGVEGETDNKVTSDGKEEVDGINGTDATDIKKDLSLGKIAIEVPPNARAARRDY